MLQLWILFLCFYFGGIGSGSSSVPHLPHLPHLPQSLNLQVEHGQAAILPCDGASLVDDSGDVQWEAVGDDVISVQGEELKVGKRFTGRVHFASEDKWKEGNWSVKVEPVRFSDTNMYECIWDKRRTLSTVWLKVTPPDIEGTLVASVGDSVVLRCFLDVPRMSSAEQLEVWWERDRFRLMVQEQGQVLVSSDSDLHPQLHHIPEQTNTAETFHVNFILTTPDDAGEYSCWYKTRSSDDPSAGTPGTITLMVLEPNYQDPGFNVTTETPQTTTHHFDLTTETAQTTTDLSPVLLLESTPALEVVTERQPMEAFEQTVTSSFPDDDSAQTWVESSQWNSFPWVRIGLIAGVLLVTVVVLCVLRALQKL